MRVRRRGQNSPLSRNAQLLLSLNRSGRSVEGIMLLSFVSGLRSPSVWLLTKAFWTAAAVAISLLPPLLLTRLTEIHVGLQRHARGVKEKRSGIQCILHSETVLAGLAYMFIFCTLATWVYPILHWSS